MTKNYFGYVDLVTFISRDRETLISSVEVSNISFSGAKIRWKTNRLTFAKVVFGTSIYELDEAFSERSHSHHHQVMLTDLLPAKTYYYRVHTEDDLGRVSRSPIKTFTTANLPVSRVALSNTQIENTAQ